MVCIFSTLRLLLPENPVGELNEIWPVGRWSVPVLVLAERNVARVDEGVYRRKCSCAQCLHAINLPRWTSRCSGYKHALSILPGIPGKILGIFDERSSADKHGMWRGEGDELVAVHRHLVGRVANCRIAQEVSSKPVELRIASQVADRFAIVAAVQVGSARP